MNVTEMTRKGTVLIKIRWMIRKDMPDVLESEASCFDYAWNEEDFLRCLRQRNCIGMVAEINDKFAGFIIYELFRSRLHIINFAVIPQYRRLGVGSLLIEKLIGKLSGHRRTKITLAVRESNLGAQLFFRNQYFKAVKVLRKYYRDSNEDAYLMQYSLDADAGYEEEQDDLANRIAQFEDY